MNPQNPLSSNALFHVMSKYEYLETKLKQKKFVARYVKENYLFLSAPFSNYYWIPMICFTDLPLTKQIKHLNWYGDKTGQAYCIGMKKAWIENQKISPVFYLVKGSSTHKIIQNQTLTKMHCYVKEFEGNQTHPNLGDKELKFYDEREWRFIPDIELAQLFTTKNPMDDKNFVVNSAFDLPFEYDDIAYIIIPNEHSKTNLFNVINIDLNELEEHEKYELIRKIILVDEIYTDF